MTLSIVWEGITIAVSHKANWLNTEHDHIELRTDEKLPVTETGYRSHFIANAELALFDSLALQDLKPHGFTLGRLKGWC